MSIFHKLYGAIQDAAFIWRQELKQVFKDEGVLIFCIIVPIVYPLLYSWIYNNEVVHEVPVVVVDQSHSQMSRQFIRMCDASPDVKVVSYAGSIEDAKSLVSRQVAKGIYFIPSDFATHINRMEQGVVSVYCDMSLMLTYKAIYQTSVAVSQTMGAEIQKRVSGNYTDQQTLVLGIGLAAGTARERNRFEDLVPIHKCYGGVYRIVGGKAMCYIMIYIFMAAWLTIIVPRIFSFLALIHWQDLLALMIPYLLACVFFGMTVSCLVRYRENVMLIMVFVSVPLLFLSGVSWPQSNIPGVWQGISWLFPSTFGIRAFVRMNTLGGTLSDVLFEIRCLWIQVAAYFGAACLVYGHQLRLSRRHAQERLIYLRRKREIRQQLKQRHSRKDLQKS